MSSVADEIVIEPNTKRGRYEDEDRLSDLPDCVLLHLLSFLDTKHAIQTSILSTKWKHLWKRIPALILHSKNFSTSKIFVKFVSRIFDILDGSIALHTFDLDSFSAFSEPRFLKRIAHCVFSHSVQLQQLGLSLKGDSSLFLPCISSCRALTSLKLLVYPKGRYGSGGKTLFPKSLNLPALITLDLTNFVFCANDNASSADPFSTFKSLNTLILCRCAVKDAPILSISSATLVNLTIDRCYRDLTKIEITAPSLSTFTFIGSPYQKLCGSTLSSIKQVNIDAYASMGYPSWEAPLVLLTWLIDLPNIKSLEVTSRTLLVLSSVPDLLKLKFTSLCNLNSLKVEMKPSPLQDYKYLCVMLENKSKKEASKIKEAFKAGLEPCATILDRTVGFLLQNSPLAEVDTIGYRSAYKLMQNYTSSNENTAEKSQPNTNSPPLDNGS